jgi:hypothetical protein
MVDPVSYWRRLGAQCVHPEDRPFIASSDFETSLLPQPWVGPLLGADIFVLQLNPGLDGAETEFERARADFRSALRANLQGQSTNLFLDPRFRDHPGAAWVRRILGANATSSVASRICMVELVPYHSRSGGVARAVAPHLPSTAVMRDWVRGQLVPRAQRGEILLIVQRAARAWGLDTATPDKGIVVYSPGQARGGYLTPKTSGGLGIAARLGTENSEPRTIATRPLNRTRSVMPLSEIDTDAAALAGQLGQCSSQVRDIFFALDRALEAAGLPFERSPLRRSGAWLARSYKLGSKSLLRVDPKGDWLKVKVGPNNAATIPQSLRPLGEKRDDWIVITPTTRDIGIKFAVRAMKTNAGLGEEDE